MTRPLRERGSGHGPRQRRDLHGPARALPAGTPLLGYGHRVSFGLVPQAAAGRRRRGFAKDMLLYDQGGCLSPQTDLVEGDWEGALISPPVWREALFGAVPRIHCRCGR